jgi:ABC-2 type transport system permease protein
MSVWSSVRLVIAREFYARKRAFTIITATLAGMATAGIVIARVLSEGSTAEGLTGDNADEVVGFLSVVVLFIGIIMTGQVIMEGVAEEKRSRVIEVVLGTMLPRHLLAGKVAAIGLMGLVEIVVLVGAVAAAGQMIDLFEVPVGTLMGLVSVVVWFVLGFAIYAALYGAAGAMVAPHENVANGAIPINLTLAVPYMVAITSASEGDNVVLQVLSLFPLTAPLSMPLRMIRGYAEVWEIALSISLMVIAIYLLIRLAGRLYAGAVMRGGKVKWRDAWRAAGDMG